jgi:uncharacterized protein (TIGR02466 family)
MAQITPFYAIPVAFDKLENAAALNAELRELFIARATEGARYANPRPLTQRNPQLFESNFDLFRWPEPCIQRLKEYCWRNLMQVIRELNRYDQAMMSRLLIYNDAWYHVTRRGGFFALHNHPMAAWSGVYCVSAGQPDADKPDSGLLSFLNPSVIGSMYLDASTTNIQGVYSTHIRNIRLEPGQLIIFPSWLLHDVKPFEGEGERLTVSFNTWFGLKDTPGGQG